MKMSIVPLFLVSLVGFAFPAHADVASSDAGSAAPVDAGSAAPVAPAKIQEVSMITLDDATKCLEEGGTLYVSCVKPVKDEAEKPRDVKKPRPPSATKAQWLRFYEALEKRVFTVERIVGSHKDQLAALRAEIDAIKADILALKDADKKHDQRLDRIEAILAGQSPPVGSAPSPGDSVDYSVDIASIKVRLDKLESGRGGDLSQVLADIEKLEVGQQVLVDKVKKLEEDVAALKESDKKQDDMIAKIIKQSGENIRLSLILDGGVSFTNDTLIMRGSQDPLRLKGPFSQAARVGWGVGTKVDWFVAKAEIGFDLNFDTIGENTQAFSWGTHGGVATLVAFGDTGLAGGTFAEVRYNRVDGIPSTPSAEELSGIVGLELDYTIDLPDSDASVTLFGKAGGGVRDIWTHTSTGEDPWSADPVGVVNVGVSFNF